MDELSVRERTLLFLYGTPHIVGSVAALAGLGLFFAGVIDRYWWAIVPAMYLGGFLVVPRDKTIEGIVRAQFNEENLRERLDDLIHAARNRVPAEAGTRLEAIREQAALLLPKLKELTERGALVSSVRHDIVQTLTRYLPDTMGAYLRLPAAYKKLVRDREGRSPDALLVQQLRLLEENLSRAVHDAFAEDIAQLEIQGRFLSEKFAPAAH
jgi:hypothetical protein